MTSLITPGGSSSPFVSLAIFSEYCASMLKSETTLEVVLRKRSGNLGRPKELLQALFDLDADRVLDARVHKIESYVDFDDRLISVGAGWAVPERFDPWAAPPRRSAAAAL